MFKLDDPKPEVLPIAGLQNVIAIDYDMENNCVFYADIVLDTISVNNLFIKALILVPMFLS